MTVMSESKYNSSISFGSEKKGLYFLKSANLSIFILFAFLIPGSFLYALDLNDSAQLSVLPSFL